MGLVKKPTGFVTSSRCLVEEFSRKCDGGHDHVRLMVGRAAAARVCPEMLCEAICRGVVKQKKFEKTSRVTTGRLSYLGLKTFVRHVCELQDSSADRVENLLSTSLSEVTRRPTGEYPPHWVDY